MFSPNVAAVKCLRLNFFLRSSALPT